MLRLFVFFLCMPLFADVDIDITANKITKTNNIVKLEGNTTAKLLGYDIGSTRAILDTDKSIFELEENVFLKKDNLLINSHKVAINMKNENINLEKFHLKDTKSNLWIDSDGAKACNGVYMIEDSMFSSCDDDNLSWNITFSNGQYDEKENSFYLNNAVLSIYNIPVLYTPYLSIPNKVRKTGFLTPEFSISSSELGYMQPLYINIDESNDLELTSNIRTKKGLGLNTLYRLASSKNSRTNMQLIYFQYNQDYINEFSLENKNVYGFELEHSINIQDEGYNKQKFYVDLRKSNSSNYEAFKNLDTSNVSTLKKTTSKVGYINTHKDWYFDIFIKQYDDVNNSDISRKLPQLNIHKNITNLFIDNLYYVIDFKSQNLYRKNKVSLLANRATLQVIYDKYFFDNYINFSFYNNISYSFDNFYVPQSSVDNEYTKVYHKATISTDLMGKYKDLSHNIQADISYLVLGYKDGYPFAYNIYDSDIQLTHKQDLNSKLEINLKNYFYNGHDKVFHHKITGKIDHVNPGELSEEIQETSILNNMSFSLGNHINYENKIEYSVTDNQIDKVLSSLEYKQQDSLMLHHIYDAKDNTYKSDYFRLKSKKKISKEYSLLLDLDFDNKLNNINRWGIGFEKDEDCFAYKLKLSKNNVLANANEETILYFKVNLKPLGGFEQKYENI